MSDDAYSTAQRDLHARLDAALRRIEALELEVARLRRPMVELSIPAADVVAIKERLERIERQLGAPLGRDLRPQKDWNACPYASHADDCTCRGEGGDR